MILIIFKIFKIYIKYSSCNYSKGSNAVNGDAASPLGMGYWSITGYLRHFVRFP